MRSAEHSNLNFFKRIFDSRPFLIISGIALFGISVPLDYIHSGPIFRFAEAHKNLVSSLTSASGFFAAAVFFASYFRERASRRQSKIYTVAYRGLCQTANDVIRHLLAPLNGMDLFAEGISLPTLPRNESNQERLERHNLKPGTFKIDAFLRDGERENDQLHENLNKLLTEEGFVQELYLVTARIRRSTQESTALWAPVMLTSKHLEEDLGRFRTVTDELELLQEYLRRLRNALKSKESCTEESRDTEEQFWKTILRTHPIFIDFAKKSDFKSVNLGLIKI